MLKVFIIGILGLFSEMAIGQNGSTLTAWQRNGFRESHLARSLFWDSQGGLWIGLKEGIRYIRGDKVCTVDRKWDLINLSEANGIIWLLIAGQAPQKVVWDKYLCPQLQEEILPKSLNIVYLVGIAAISKNHLILSTTESVVFWDVAKQVVKPILSQSATQILKVSPKEVWIKDKTHRVWKWTPQTGPRIFSQNKGNVIVFNHQGGLCLLHKRQGKCSDGTTHRLPFEIQENTKQVVHTTSGWWHLSYEGHLQNETLEVAGIYRTIFADPENQFWAISGNEGIFIRPNRAAGLSVQSIPINQALSQGQIIDALQMPEGSVWLNSTTSTAVWDGRKMVEANKPDVARLFIEQASGEKINITEKGVYVSGQLISSEQTWQVLPGTRGPIFVYRNVVIQTNWQGKQLFAHKIPEVKRVWESPEKVYWAYTSKNHLYRWTQENQPEFYCQLPNAGRVNDMIQMPDGSLWLAMQKGLYQRTADGHFKHHSIISAYPTILSIALHSPHLVIASTEDALHLYDTSGQYRAFYPMKEDRILRLFTSPFMLGEVWAIGWYGIYRVKYQDKNPSTSWKIPHLYQGGTWKPISQASALLFTGTQIALVFEVVQADHTQYPTSYLYRLDGRDSVGVWHYAEGRERILHEVSPGNYRIQIKGINPNGQISTKPVTAMFTIAPYYWEQPWFWTLCIFFVIGIGYRWHEYRIESQRRIKEAEIRTLLIEKKGKDTLELYKKTVAAFMHQDIRNSFVAIQKRTEFLLSLSLSSEASKEGNKILNNAIVGAEKSKTIEQKIKSGHSDGKNVFEMICMNAKHFYDEDCFLISGREVIECLQFKDDIGLALYYICTEAIGNAVKHGNANEIQLQFESIENSLIITVKDNGCGFDTMILKNKSKKQSGFLYLDEFAQKYNATYELDTDIGKGTILKLIIPETAFINM